MAEDDENVTPSEANEVSADGQEASVKKKTDATKGAESSAAPKVVYIVLGLNLLVLAALAAFVWMNLSKSKTSISLADVESAKVESQALEETPVAEESKFIKETFTVNLADTTGTHFAKVDVEIEVGDDFVRGEVERLKPRIRDFIVVILSSKTYEQIASIEGRDFLREEIRNKINGYLPRGQIKNVYFTQFIIQ